MSGSLLVDAGNIAGVSVIANTGSYRTKPAGPLPPALYVLSIRSATPPHLPLFEYIFPLSPSALRKEPIAMANAYDVGGAPLNFGVQRIADVYGEAPPVFVIEGTTGVKYHSTDRFLFTGLESIQMLEAAISQYFGLVSAANGKNLPRLEFYDYFSSGFYQVVPVGPQGIIQNVARPQLLNYRFRWMAIANLEQPVVQGVDNLIGLLSAPINAAVSSIGKTISSVVNTYSPFGPVSL